MYARVENGTVVEYPLTDRQVRRRFPAVSLPVEFPAHENYARVHQTERPTDTVEDAPVLVDGVWIQTWRALTVEEQADELARTRSRMRCSRYQGRAALKARGLLATVEAMVAQADEDTQMAWAEATEWKRTSPMLNALASGLGLTDEQLDDLFAVAAQIEV